MAIRLSPNEQAIMELIWSAGRPLSRQEILEGTDGRSWNPASIHLVLNNMLSKGILRITDQTVRYGRTYGATMPRCEYIAQYAEEVAKGNTQRDRTLDLAMCLVCRDGIDADTIAELEQMLEARRKELLAEGAPEEG
ncbi:MAG: BlaI/MecI/CopY family transcriptional regulator [Oscillospiraceae bacterium]|nr:putative regulatory protein [Firmicutes bacterium CAG:137]